MQWKLKTEKTPKNFEQVRQILLENRNISQEGITAFFEPKHPVELTISDVGILESGMEQAVAIISDAISNNKKIVVFGDYDADGICASAILWEVLYAEFIQTHGVDAEIPIPFIPQREKHGYGISEQAISEIIEEHAPDIIITVDNGIVAHTPIQFAKDQGITCIVTDHHQPEQDQSGNFIYPNADAIVHTTQLCGATVAWMLARELDTTAAVNKSIELAGIATIADQVPLLEANRSFAQHGVIALQKSTRVGIQELCKLAGIKQQFLTEWNVGFGLAPRINAMGRLDHGMPALRLLCTNNIQRAQRLAAVLSDTNVTRQDLTKEMLDDAKSQVEVIKDEHIIIVHSDQYHEGILGLIAGGLTEKYYKPAIAISTANSIAKASARSVPGVNIVELIRTIQDELLSVGGHPMAAGFSFTPEKIDLVLKKLFSVAKKDISQSDLEKSIEVDCKLPNSLVSVATVEHLDEFSPFGMGNPAPVFEIDEVVILELKTMGKDQEHLKLAFDSFECVAWRKSYLAANLKAHMKVNLVGSLSINEWNGSKKVQLQLKDVKPA